MVGAVEAGEEVEERRLPCAVRPDERDDVAARDLEVVDVDGQDPPNARRTSLASSSALASGIPRNTVSAHRRGLLAIAEQALRTEDHEQHERETDEGEADGTDVGGSRTSPRPPPGSPGGAASRGPGYKNQNTMLPTIGTQHGPDATDDEHREHEERERGLPVVGVRELGVDGDEDAPEGADHAADDELTAA